MKYEFAILDYQDGDWVIRRRFRDSPDYRTEFELKGAATQYLERNLDGTLWTFGENPPLVAGLVYKRNGDAQEVILNEPAFVEMVKQYGGAGTLGTYHIERREPVPNADWLLRKASYPDAEMSTVRTFDTKKEARQQAHEWLYNRTNVLATLEHHWKTGEVTNVSTAPFLWDWIHKQKREL